MKIYSRYDTPKHPGLICEGATRTQQHFKDDADINNIVARNRVSNDPMNPPSRRPIFGEFASLPEYQTAQTAIAHANQAFATLDSGLRKRFSNNPAEMIAFLDDPSNRDEAIRLGLVKQPELETASNSAQLPT